MAKDTKQTDEQVEEGIPVEYFRKRHHDGGPTFGLVVLFAGILFLLNNLGLVPWSVWNELWKFWPVVIIIIGIRMLAGKTLIARIVFSLLTVFIFAGILAYILYYYGVFKVFGFPF